MFCGRFIENCFFTKVAHYCFILIIKLLCGQRSKYANDNSKITQIQLRQTITPIFLTCKKSKWIKSKWVTPTLQLFVDVRKAGDKKFMHINHYSIDFTLICEQTICHPYLICHPFFLPLSSQVNIEFQQTILSLK